MKYLFIIKENFSDRIKVYDFMSVIKRIENSITWKKEYILRQFVSPTSNFVPSTSPLFSKKKFQSAEANV